MKVGPNVNEDRIVTKWGGAEDPEAENPEYLGIIQSIIDALKPSD